MKNLTINHLKPIILSVFFIAWAILFTACNQINKGKTNVTAMVSANNTPLPQLLIRTGELSNSGEWQKTIQAVGKINQKLDIYPGDMKSRLQLAEIYINEARVTGEHGYYYPAILNILDGIITNKPSDDEVIFRTLSLKSSVLLSLHRFDEARQLAAIAVKLKPENAQIYGALTDANVELGNYKQAVEMATRMMELRPDLLSYSRASYLREIHGDPKGAVEAMNLAVSSGFPGYENTAWARLALGHIHENYGNLTDAEYQYQMALAERPGYPFAIAALAGIEIKKGNLVQAESMLTKAIEIIPELSFYIQLANLYNATGRHDIAEQTTETIFDMLADDEANGHRMDLEYAKVYLNLKHDYDKALQRTLIEYTVRPANIDVNKLLAQIYYVKRNLQKAETHLAIALRTSSQDPELLMIAGLIYAKTDKKTQAVRMINKSREQNPYQKNQFANEASATLIALGN